jgi:F-type H+-transporting ATPase subunit g
MWKELDHLKVKLTHRNDLELEDLGISLLFVVECYGWFCMGEIIGRGGTITGYKV